MRILSLVIFELICTANVCLYNNLIQFSHVSLLEIRSFELILFFVQQLCVEIRFTKIIFSTLYFLMAAPSIK